MSLAYVVDASCALAFLLPDEKWARAGIVDALFADYSKGKCVLISTALLPFEVGNGLKSAVRRRRLTEETARMLLYDFLGLSIPVDDVDFIKAWQIANQNNLSVYDAAYVALSRATGYPLLTLDDRLQKIFPP